MPIYQVIIICVLISILYGVMYNYLYSRRLKKIKLNHQKSVDILYEKLDKESGYKARAFELEDKFEDAYQVKIRNEVTVVNTDFSKIELVIFLSGVHKLMNNSKTIEDSKIYIALLEKLQKFIDLIKEDEPEQEKINGL